MAKTTGIIVASPRVRRIGRFIDQLSLYLHHRCVENDLPATPIEPFVTELFGKMARSDEELCIMSLLDLLLDEDCMDEIFYQFRRSMTADD